MIRYAKYILFTYPTCSAGFFSLALSFTAFFDILSVKSLINKSFFINACVNVYTKDGSLDQNLTRYFFKSASGNIPLGGLNSINTS